MRNTFASLLNCTGAMKGRLLLGVAGILCAIMVAALVAPVLAPHTQGSAGPNEELLLLYDDECSDMYGCTSVRASCGDRCKITFLNITISWADCCPVGDVGSCMYCDD